MKERLPCLIVAFFIFFFIVSPVYGKSYWLPEVNCRIDVLDDGSLKWDYSLKFSFSGRFSYAYVDIPTSGVIIDEISATEPYTIEFKSNVVRVRWNFSAENEDRTFRLSYRLKKGA